MSSVESAADDALPLAASLVAVKPSCITWSAFHAASFCVQEDVQMPKLIKPLQRFSALPFARSGCKAVGFGHAGDD
jgi:hypothetical protein